MTLSINFDGHEDFCYFVHDQETAETWNLPNDINNVDEAIAYVHREYPLAEIVVGDSAQEN